MPAPFTLLNSAAPMESAFLKFGVMVERAAATLPQTGLKNIFTISGGRVVLLALVGEVTTVIQTQANNTKLTATPTVGTATDLCAVTSITAAAVGAYLTLPLLSASALVVIAGGFGSLLQPPIVIDPGAITLNCAASNTGAIKWSLRYCAFDPLGRVAATAISGAGP